MNLYIKYFYYKVRKDFFRGLKEFYLFLKLSIEFEKINLKQWCIFKYMKIKKIKSIEVKYNKNRINTRKWNL